MLLPLTFFLKALHYLPAGGDTCFPCDCYKLGSRDITCHSVTGQCKCYDGVVGRRCDQCDSIYAAVTNTQKKLNDTAYIETVTCVGEFYMLSVGCIERYLPEMSVVMAIVMQLL